MKKSEKDALKNAFNIPEPKHKNTFVSSYNEMLKKNERKFNIPAFFRWTSTAVFAALIIGVWGSLSKNAGFPDEFTKDKPNIITETTTTSINTTVKSNDITKTVTSSMPLNTVTSAESRTTTSETSAASEKTRKTIINTSTSSLSSSAITTKPQTDSTAKVTAITAAEPENTATAEVTQTTAVTAVSITKTTVRTTTHAAIKTTATSLTTTGKTTTVKTTTLKTTTVTTENNAFSPEPTTPTTNNDELPLVVPSVVPSTTRTTDRQDETNCTTFSQIPSVDVPPSGTNYTVTPSANYSKSDNIIDINNIFENNASLEPNDNILNPYDLINNSGYIVFGRIDEIIYTEVNGMPCTQENITVYKVYKGGRLFPMDRISVYMKGGYMPVKDFTSIHCIDNEYPDNYSVYDSGGNNGTQNVGDVFLFFISDGTISLPDGAFMLTSYNDTSVFSSEDNKYISLGNENIIFNINDLLNN